MDAFLSHQERPGNRCFLLIKLDWKSDRSSI